MCIYMDMLTDYGRRQSINLDMLLRKRPCEGPHESDNGVFRRCVDRGYGEGVEACIRSRADDASSGGESGCRGRR